jgi:hypothetical protein
MDSAVWILLIVVCLSGLGYMRGISLLLRGDIERDMNPRHRRDDKVSREIEELERMAGLQ